MSSSSPALQRARLAFELLAAARPLPRPFLSGDPVDGAALARKIADNATELSLALAEMVRSGNATAHATRISAALAAQHEAIRRLHHLPARPEKS